MYDSQPYHCCTKLRWTAKETGWTDAAREEFGAMHSATSHAHKKWKSMSEKATLLHIARMGVGQ